MLENIYDMAVGDRPEDEKRFDYRELQKDSMVLLVPASYDLTPKMLKREEFPFPWVDLRTLGDVDFVFQDESTRIYTEIKALLKKAETRIQPKLMVTNSILAIQSAERQQGCCIISSLFLPYIASVDQVHCYSVGEPEGFTSLGCISQRGKVFTAQEKYKPSCDPGYAS